MAKSADAFRTISEVAEWLDTPAHVLRFWESKFTQVKPVKRAGGRRYYRRQDMELLAGIKKLLHDDGMTIKAVQRLLREEGVKHVAALGGGMDPETESTETESTETESVETESTANTAEDRADAVQAAPPLQEVPHPGNAEQEKAAEAADNTPPQPAEPRSDTGGAALFSTPPVPAEPTPELAPSPSPAPAPAPQAASPDAETAPDTVTDPATEAEPDSSPWPADDSATPAPDQSAEPWPHAGAPLKTSDTAATAATIPESAPDPAPASVDAPVDAPVDAFASAPDTPPETDPETAPGPDRTWPVDDASAPAPEKAEEAWPHADEPLKTAATMPETTPADSAGPRPIVIELTDDPADTLPAPRGALSRVQDLPRPLTPAQAAALAPLRDRLRRLLDNSA